VVPVVTTRSGPSTAAVGAVGSSRAVDTLDVVMRATITRYPIGGASSRLSRWAAVGGVVTDSRLGYFGRPGKRMRHQLVASAALVCVTAFVAGASGEPFSIAPVAAWVEPMPASSVEGRAPSKSPDGAARAGLRGVLADEQVRLGPRGVERYVRRAHEVLSSTGVQAGSEISIAFDPTYERLVLHRIRIRRDGKERDGLDPASIRTFYQEDDAEERIYNGAMTALAVLRDVRAGDTVDFDYTIEGDNPVFAGKFADAFALVRRLDTDRLRYRLLVPAARSVQAVPQGLSISPATRELDGYRELVWQREGVAAFEHEDDTPASFGGLAEIELSEYASWQEVAKWASSVLAPPAELDRAIVDKAEEIRRAHPDAEAQVVAATRFVQDEVRYLGIEMGEHSHRPHPPSEVLSRRFGDCKDKALLLVELLRALGTSANVALVHSRAGHRIAQGIPTPHAFNHVIVRAEVGGRVRWIDATIADQGGPLASLHVPSYGWALVVAPGSTGLTRVEAPTIDAPTISVREVYDATKSAPGARLTVETTSIGPDADRLRALLAAIPRAELAKDWLNDYANDEPSIRADGDLEVSDDRDANRIVVRERYVIDDYVREQWACFRANSLGRALRRPRTRLRTTPLAVEFPFFVRHEVEVHVPDVSSVPEDMTLASDAISFSRQVTDLGRIVRVSFDLRTRRDSVDVAGVAAHMRTVDSIREATWACVGAEVGKKRAGLSLPKWWGWAVGGVVGVVAAVVGAARLPRWVRARR